MDRIRPLDDIFVRLDSYLIQHFLFNVFQRRACIFEGLPLVSFNFSHSAQSDLEVKNPQARFHHETFHSVPLHAAASVLD